MSGIKFIFGGKLQEISPSQIGHCAASASFFQIQPDSTIFNQLQEASISFKKLEKASISFIKLQQASDTFCQCFPFAFRSV